MSRRNEFLDHGSSDESDIDAGYDSEALEASKTARKTDSRPQSVKRRKLSRSASDSEDEIDATFLTAEDILSPVKNQLSEAQHASNSNTAAAIDSDVEQVELDHMIKSPTTAHRRKTVESTSRKKDKKEQIPGVVYLSSLPPYLKPTALRNLLTQRGFSPITRLFLTPASKQKHSSKKNSRQLYTEGWIEFASKKTARRCAEALNAQLVGGRKGGYYHDDLWNMKYLKGMSWEELMSGIREERREEEGRRDEERRRVAAETKAFVEGVEEGRKVQGMQKKRKAKEARVQDDNSLKRQDEEVKRTWRQFQVAGTKKEKSQTQQEARVERDFQQVLAKIF